MIEAHEYNDFSRKGLGRYRKLLEESFVMKDLKTFRHAPHMLHIDRIYETYPELVCSMMEDIYGIERQAEAEHLQTRLPRSDGKGRHQECAVRRPDRLEGTVNIDEIFDYTSFSIDREPHIVLDPTVCAGCDQRGCVTSCPARCYTCHEEEQTDDLRL